MFGSVVFAVFAEPRFSNHNPPETLRNAARERSAFADASLTQSCTNARAAPKLKVTVARVIESRAA
jgi:hypothetical protein